MCIRDRIVGLLDKFENLVNSKKVSATEVIKMLDDITKILNDNLPKRKTKSKTSAPEKEKKVEEKVENLENQIENEKNQNV